MSIQTTSGRHRARRSVRQWCTGLFHRSPRPVHTCICGAELPIEEPVRPLAAGHMRQRPGAPTYDTLIRPDATPTLALNAFRSGAEVKMSAAAVGIETGMRGHVSRVAPFRQSKPVGVRMCGPWGPLTWFDPWELELVEADTAVLDAVGPAGPVERVEGAWIGCWRPEPEPAATTLVMDAARVDEPLLDGAR